MMFQLSRRRTHRNLIAVPEDGEGFLGIEMALVMVNQRRVEERDQFLFDLKMKTEMEKGAL